MSERECGEVSTLSRSIGAISILGVQPQAAAHQSELSTGFVAGNARGGDAQCGPAVEIEEIML